jgi:hypothetical protein
VFVCGRCGAKEKSNVCRVFCFDAPAALVDERNRGVGTLGADTDGERAIRWLIVLMALCFDPPAIALTAGACAGRTIEI